MSGEQVLCTNCSIHLAEEGEHLCSFCRESLCVVCCYHKREGGTRFCNACNDPEKIIVFCSSCAACFEISRDDARLLLSYPELSSIELKEGLTFKLSQCHICHEAHQDNIVEISVYSRW